MKVVSIDIETTGLNPDTDKLLELAAVVDDLSISIAEENLIEYVDTLPSISIVNRLDRLEGNPYALNMNQNLIKVISEGKDSRLTKEEDILPSLKKFLYETNFIDGGYRGAINIVGKNFFGFDYGFIAKLPYMEQLKFRRRAFDPAILYVIPEDIELPSLSTCIQRSGLNLNSFWDLHTGIGDAKITLALLRKAFRYYVKDN